MDSTASGRTVSARAALRFAAILLLLIFNMAPRAGASEAGSTILFRIPATDLPAALLLFSRQAGVQVISAANDVRQEQTRGLNGRFTITAALQALLSGTNLAYRVSGSGVVTVGHFAAPVTAGTDGSREDRVDRPSDPDPAPAGGNASAVQDQSSGVLQEVVVTAERRATGVLRTPISITVETGEQLEAHHQEQITNLQTTTPNFVVDTIGVNSADLSIRGVGSSPGSSVAGISPGVEIIRDGLLNPETQGSSVSIPFYDIQDVEVLKGPQGTFVGAASTAGAVEITSRNPSLGAGITGYAEGQWGNYADLKLDGAVNLPLSDTWAARIAFSQEEMHSFYRNLGGIPSPGISSSSVSDPGAVNNRGVRLSLLWKPTATFQALWKTSFDTIYSPGDPAQPNQATYVNTVTGAVSHSPFYAKSTHEPYVIDPFLPVQQDNAGMLANALELKYTLPDNIVLRSLTGYQRSFQETYTATDGSVPVNGGFSYGTVEPDVYRSEEINVISPTEWRLNFVAGAEWFYRSTETNTFSEKFTPPYSQAAPAIGTAEASGPGIYTVARNEGVFGQINYQISNAWQLQVGVRQNWDNIFVNGGLDNYVPCAGGAYGFSQVPGIAYCQNISSRASWFKDSKPTGKVGINWTLSPGQYIYGFVAQGYKAGGVTPVDVFEPEAVTDYELGWKGRLFNGHLVTQLGGFYMNYLHMQEQIFSTTGVSSSVFNLTSGSKIAGAELSMQALFGQVGSDLSVGYTHSALGALSAVRSYELPLSAQSGVGQCQGSAGTAPPPTPCFNFAPYQANLSGESNPLSPNVSLNLDLTYKIQIGSNTLTPRATYSYTSSQYTSLFQISYNEIPARTLLGADVTYAAGPWLTDLYGTNLANKVYLVGVNGNNVYYGAPRQFGIRVNRSF